MSRLSQFVDFLNSDGIITAYDKINKYSDITIDDNLLKIRREYKKSAINQENIDSFVKDFISLLSDEDNKIDI